MSSPVWFITAASSGFGKEIALNALKKGHRVIATGRSLDRLTAVEEAGAEVYILDVTSPLDSIIDTVNKAHSTYGRIDILVNSAGYILEAAVEEASPQETFDQFNTNVFGALNVTRAVLPHMRAQRSGVIALFGSLGSWTGGPAYGLYAATKWACSGIAESLRPELAEYGIEACTIEPGYFRSGFLNAGVKVQSAQRIRDYEEGAVGRVRKALEMTGGTQMGDVRKGADVIVDVLAKRGFAEGKEVPIRLVLGSDCEAVIRGKLDDTRALLDEWKEVTRSTDYPKGE